MADDHPLWLGALERDLVAAGLRVVATAADGPATVRRAHATRPDVLVLDLNLPGLPMYRDAEGWDADRLELWAITWLVQHLPC